MKKCAASLALSLTFIASNGIAEESGLFIGVGTGYGQSEIKSNNTKTKLDGLSFETIVGYKSFLTPAFGSDILKLKTLECCADCKVKVMFEGAH